MRCRNCNRTGIPSDGSGNESCTWCGSECLTPEEETLGTSEIEFAPHRAEHDRLENLLKDDQELKRLRDELDMYPRCPEFNEDIARTTRKILERENYLLGEFFEADSESRCECGAEHTSFPQLHSDWCEKSR